MACGAQRRAASRKPLLSPVPEYETRWQGGGQWSQSHWPSGPRLHGGRKAASALAATSRRLPPFPCRQRGTAEAAGSARRPHAERWPCTTTTRGRARPTSMPRYRLGHLAEARPRPGLPSAPLGSPAPSEAGRVCPSPVPGAGTADEAPARGPPSELGPLRVLSVPGARAVPAAPVRTPCLVPTSDETALHPWWTRRDNALTSEGFSHPAKGRLQYGPYTAESIPRPQVRPALKTHHWQDLAGTPSSGREGVSRHGTVCKGGPRSVSSLSPKRLRRGSLVCAFLPHLVA